MSRQSMNEYRSFLTKILYKVTILTSFTTKETGTYKLNTSAFLIYTYAYMTIILRYVLFFFTVLVHTVKSQKYRDLYYNSNSKITGGSMQKTYYAI